MLKRFMSVLLIFALLVTGFVLPANAQEIKNESKKYDFSDRAVKGVVEGNRISYYDSELNKVDPTSYNRDGVALYADLPSSFNLKDENRVTPVKDQGGLGLCWDFASTASIESSVLSNEELLAELPDNAHEILDLSEAGNSWYIHTNTTDRGSMLYDDYMNDPDKGTRGGNSETVAMGLSSGYGAYPEELIEYSQWKNGYNESLRYYSDYRLKEYSQFENMDDTIKISLMEKGAATLCFYCYMSNFNMTEDGMQAYHDNGDAIDSSIKSDSHVVTVVGWDDNFSKENFCEEMQPSTDGAWLCKNSWGEDGGSKAEGYEGYFWISYETEVFDIAQFEVQSTDVFDNIYQNEIVSMMYMEDTYSCANVFVAQSDEKLEQICFGNMGYADLTVSIYKLNDNYTSPQDGELISSFETSVDCAGVHSVDCPDGIYLDKGDKFSVVLYCADGMAIKYGSKDNSEHRNISYLSDENNNWVDVVDIYYTGNVCIKALTSNKDKAVRKDKLKNSIDEAETLVYSEEVPQYMIDELHTQLENAKNVFAASDVNQNKVDNTTCLLNSSIESINKYFYEINSLEDFMHYYNTLTQEGYFYSDKIILNTDLDLSSLDCFEPLYTTSHFQGVFDGNNHTISGLKIDVSDTNGGFFANTNGATIKNVTFEDCDVTSSFSAGVVIGYAKSTVIENCHVKSSQVYGKNEYAALITGGCSESAIENCSVTDSEAVAKFGAGVFMPLEQNVVGSTAKNVTLQSTLRVTNANGTTILAECDTADAPLITLKDSVCTFSNFMGELQGVELNGKALEKNEDGFVFEVGEDKLYTAYMSFAPSKSYEFGFESDIKTRTANILYYFGEDTHVTIPGEIRGLKVVSIDIDFKFFTEEPIVGITFEGELETISDGLFNSLDSVETIVFEEGITSIGTYSFNYLDSLKNVSFPKSLQKIGYFSFAYCHNIEKLTLPENLKVIGASVFASCTNLKDIVIPDSVETIEASAFQNCAATCVVFGKNIKKVQGEGIGYTSKVGEKFRFVRIPGFKVYGYAGTGAETYAKDNGFEFVDITDSMPEVIDNGFDYSCFMKGDVDLDSNITVMDATLLQRHLVQAETLNDVQLYNALVSDYQFEVKITDATDIQRYVAGIIKRFGTEAVG